MPKTVELVRCLLISPNDVRGELQVVRDAIHRWNATVGWVNGTIIEPVGWETHTVPELRAVDRHPQKIVNEQIVDSCDFGIAVFWTDVGSPTDTDRSGSIEEIERLREAGKTVHILFSGKPVSPKALDPDKLAAIVELRASLQSIGLYHEFESNEDLAERVGAICLKHGSSATGLVFSSKADAAPVIEALLRGEPESVTIVGSTLGGTLRALPELGSILRAKGTQFQINLMIATPKFLVNRARQEGLVAGYEIESAYQRIYELLDETEVPVERIRLYDAPPTCSAFVFRGLRKVVINPFTLTDLAENTLAVLVDGTAHVKAYDGFVRAHVDRPLEGVHTQPMSRFIPIANEWNLGRLVKLILGAQRPGSAQALAVAINGQTAVGKSRLASEIQSRIQLRGSKCSVVNTDAWLCGARAQRRFTGLDERAYDIDGLRKTLCLLRGGKGARVPTYLHEQGTKGSDTEIGPADIVLVEGLMSTHPSIETEIAIWMNHGADLHGPRRIERDIAYRGYSEEEASENWSVHEREWPRFETIYRPRRPNSTITVSKSGMWLLEMAGG